jgi:hypothetical protein
MALPNIFTKSVADGVAQRINNLTATTQPQWGKMAVAQMLAHCSVSYEMPYKKNSGTAPAFIIKDDRNFEAEKARLIGFIERTQALGEAHFDGKESNSFGNLTKTEWNNLFYKHLDHHLTQFGV